MFNWLSLAALVTKLFAAWPQIVALLEELFGKAQPTGNPADVAPPVAVQRLFAAARAQTWRYQIFKRARLNAAERVAAQHAPEVVKALKFNLPAPQLTVLDREELDDVL